ncbi:hypothetical protein [Microbacterium terricola]|uniref:Fis family transcriptional regulator n=1 Tax=Microbacterium terricola TaxID=344163 RepID=A0ABM8DWV5_9MICO|nr:hypothetical protein [Microbacterium terricola]UYK39199.1 hypothetical protein OAU46_10880 [Microbacterium terricola]BDV30082.1 hypothetical protein Microterr_07420 [Microbacterium terricola]
MRWDRFFDDLEDQLASEWEAERAALDTEAERLRLSRVALRERLQALARRDPASSAPTFEFTDGTILAAEVSGVGADWAALQPLERRAAAVVAPLHGIGCVGVPHPDLLRSARPGEEASTLSDRMTFGFVLRDLVRRRTGVVLHLAHGRVLTGTIDRAGADHLDIALHDEGAARRSNDVTGHRMVPFAAVSWIRVAAASVLA